VEARLRWRKRVDGAEMMINTRREQPAQNGWCPTGYSCQFGGSSGRLTFISRNDVPQPPRQGGAAGVRFEPDRTYRLWFQRTGDELALFVDGRRVYQQAEPLPLAGEGLDRVAFRSWGTVDLLSISVWRLGSPTRASPVVAGDALARRGHHVQAAEEYRRIAADHPRTATAEKALARAYLLSALLPDTGDGERTLVRTLLRQQHARSRYWPRLLESDCMEAWRAGRLDEALGLARDAMSRDPDTRIALQLLASRQSAIPVQILVPLLGLLSRTTRVTSLDLSGLGLEDLSPIGGMQLTYLDCSSNHLTTLEPLAGMKLEGLVCSSNRIESLKPLAGMPLVDVGLDGCLIEDLTPLAQAQLAALSCFGNPLRSLTPFDGLRPANLFLFSTASLPKGHLDSVFEVWERNGHMSTLREAELVRALEKGDRQTLLRRASTHQGHHYLHVRLALPWAEADRLSRAIGGHLLTLADREEQEFAIGLVGPGGSTWLGLRSGAADREWVTGEPLAYTAFDGPRDRQAETPCLLLSGRDPSRCWFAADVGEELSPLVIEWDR